MVAPLGCARAGEAHANSLEGMAGRSVPSGRPEGPGGSRLERGWIRMLTSCVSVGLDVLVWYGEGARERPMMMGESVHPGHFVSRCEELRSSAARAKETPTPHSLILNPTSATMRVTMGEEGETASISSLTELRVAYFFVDTGSDMMC